MLAGNNKREQQFGQNIFSGFNVQLLSEAFGITQQTAQRIQSQNDQRGEIIRVNQGLQLLRPIVSQQGPLEQQAYQPIQGQTEQSTQYHEGQMTEYQGEVPQYQEGQSTQFPQYHEGQSTEYQQGRFPWYREGQSTQHQYGRFPQHTEGQSTKYQQGQFPKYQEGQSTGCSSNGLEENFCSLEARVNIENPKRADTYNPRAGRITSLNGNNFPILNLVQMSARRVNLYQVYMVHFSAQSY